MLDSQYGGHQLQVPLDVDSTYESYYMRMDTHKEYKAKEISPFWKGYSYNEIYAISRATLLALLIFYWCYHSLQYGPMKFTILEDRQILPGLVFSKKAVIAFSCGYSTWNSIVSVFAAIMLIYSIISKRPLFSLPLMGLFLTEVVYDSCNVLVMICLILMNLHPDIALPYIVMLLLMILAEVWMWLGVVQLYECRTYEIR
ncbi:uncharacterized protein LOC116847690 [Odontomachus brunneus]|uniref:uncharacterized protein LOC116847690 n=1 Tax=Odontomachus brunneus TaxID=486640 RepID=UPI0013F21FB1|nr:uncharacterized protein LOC116847690 [Odontomachus brunneus]